MLYFKIIEENEESNEIQQYSFVFFPQNLSKVKDFIIKLYTKFKAGVH